METELKNKLAAFDEPPRADGGWLGWDAENQKGWCSRLVTLLLGRLALSPCWRIGGQCLFFFLFWIVVKDNESSAYIGSSARHNRSNCWKLSTWPLADVLNEWDLFLWTIQHQQNPFLETSLWSDSWWSHAFDLSRGVDSQSKQLSSVQLQRSAIRCTNSNRKKITKNQQRNVQ